MSLSQRVIINPSLVWNKHLIIKGFVLNVTKLATPFGNCLGKFPFLFPFREYDLIYLFNSWQLECVFLIIKIYSEKNVQELYRCPQAFTLTMHIFILCTEIVTVKRMLYKLLNPLSLLPITAQRDSSWKQCYSYGSQSSVKQFNCFFLLEATGLHSVRQNKENTFPWLRECIQIFPI